MRKWLWLILLPIVSFGVHADDTEPQLMSFPEAARLAIATAPNLQSMRESMTIAQLELANAKADFFPKLQFDSKAGYSYNNQVTGPNESKSTLNIELANTFYDSGRKQIKQRQYKFKEQLSVLEYKQARDQLIQDVHEAFLKLSQARQLFVIEQSSHALIKRQADVATLSYERGIGKIQDRNSFANQVRRAQLAVISAEQNIKTARIELLEKLGITSDHPDYEHLDFASVDIQPEMMTNVVWQTWSLQSTYEFRKSELQQRIDNEEFALARKESQPELNLVASADYGNAVNLGHDVFTLQKDRLSAFAGVELKWTLFDWGIKQRKLQIAHANRNKQYAKLLDELNRVNAKINALIVDLNAQHESYAISKQLYGAEQENYNQVVRDFQSGNETYLRLITAINDRGKSHKRYNDVIYSLMKGIYAYYYYQGVLYEQVFPQV